MKGKEYKIDLIVHDEEDLYDEGQITDMFIEFVESKNLICAGGIRRLTEKDYEDIK